MTDSPLHPTRTPRFYTIDELESKFCWIRIAVEKAVKGSKIKHSKGAIDSERAKLFSRISNDITLAAKLGGVDPAFNIRLAACLTNAKKADMPKSNIEAAIKRASGRLSEGQAEPFTYEATMGPVGLMVETLSDKRVRTIANLKLILKKNGGTISPCAFLFDRVGNIVVSADGKSVDEMMELAIELNALDVALLQDSLFEFTTEAADLNTIAQALKGLGLELADSIELEAELRYQPKDSMTVKPDFEKQLRDLVQALEDEPDTTRVTTNVELLL